MVDVDVLMILQRETTGNVCSLLLLATLLMAKLEEVELPRFAEEAGRLPNRWNTSVALMHSPLPSMAVLC